MWPDPVVFEMSTLGLLRIGSSLEALHVLVMWWDDMKGPAHSDAIETCLASFRGERSQDEARSSFVMALAEGRMKAL